MKKRLLILAVVFVMLLAGCNESTNNNDATPTPSSSENNTQGGKFTFVYNNVKMTPNQLVASIISALGDDYTYYESQSCAYIGLDKVYAYKGFTIYTYPDDKAADHILSIVLTDDSVSTSEGIRIGDTLDKVKEVYGSEYTELDGAIAYIRGDYKLSIVLENDRVYSIQYSRKDDV